MKKPIAILFLLIPVFLYGQIKLNQTEFDLGEISLLNSDIVDFNATNISSNNVFLLRIEGEQNVGFQYTSKTFSPNKMEGIRVKLNPTKKGKIQRKVKLYFSSNESPIEISIKAVVKALPKNNRTACPQFGSALKPPSDKPQAVATIQKFNLTIQDINEEVIVAQNIENQSIEKTKTVNTTTTIVTTTITKNTPVSNREQRPVRLTKPKKVKKTPEERRNAPSIGTILFGKTKDTITTKTEEEKEPLRVIKKAAIKEQVATNEEYKKPVLADEPTNDIPVNENQNLLDKSYRPNNIVFLIDASTSMREEQKMDILKKAMIELLEPLREIDFITIVTYSGEAKVILPTSKGNLKDEIIATIEKLEADGSTNAVKGIKRAIQVGKSNFLEDGNNQIFLASDGAFNIGERNMSLRKKIEKTAQDGLTITVLGIKNDNWTNKSLKEIADLGSGDLLKIKSMKDARKVLESMKKKAQR